MSAAKENAKKDFLEQLQQRLRFLMLNLLTRDLQLEKELLQMRSTLDRENGRTPGSLGRTSPMSQEDLNRQVCKLFVL